MSTRRKIAYWFIAILAFVGAVFSQTQPATTRPTYTPPAQSVGMSATTVREGDLVAAWAAKPAQDYTRWENEFRLADPIPGIGSTPWSNDAFGADIDTSKAGTYPIVKNGFNLGTLKILPALPQTPYRVTTAAELTAAIQASKLTALSVISIAPGVYELGPEINVRGHVKLVSEIKHAAKLKSVTRVNGFMAMIGGGDVYIEGCELSGKLYAFAESSRFIATDCIFLDPEAGNNSPGAGHGGTTLWNFVALRCEIRGGLYIYSNTYLKDCRFVAVNRHNVAGGGANVAIVNCTFEKCGRGVVIGGCKQMLIAKCTFREIRGNGGNEAENVLVEGSSTGLCVDQCNFFDSVGQAVQVSAEGACRGTIISRNRVDGRALAFALYNQGRNGSIDDTAIFKNATDGVTTSLWAAPSLNPQGEQFGAVTNTRGGDNVFVDQRPAPSHIGVPKITYGDCNACPATYSDVVWGSVSGIKVLRTNGKFCPEQIGVTCKVVINGRESAFTLTSLIDEQNATFEGWPALGPGPIQKFSIPGPQPVYTSTGNNTVGATIVRPFTKLIQAGEAKVVIR